MMVNAILGLLSAPGQHDECEPIALFLLQMRYGKRGVRIAQVSKTANANKRRYH